MFDAIIVQQELTALREKAGNGDFDATYQLALTLIGKPPLLHRYEEMFGLISAVIQHPEFAKTVKQKWNSYMMLKHVLYRGYEEGEVSDERYLNFCIIYTQKAIEAMTTASISEWNFEQLYDAIESLEGYIKSYRERYSESASPDIDRL